MNISQHAFCPLGFNTGKTYNDNMVLGPSEYSSTILSPAYGHSFLVFDDIPFYIRFWSPLVKFNGSKLDSIFLEENFLFARSVYNDFFYVSCLNF